MRYILLDKEIKIQRKIVRTIGSFRLQVEERFKRLFKKFNAENKS